MAVVALTHKCLQDIINSVLENCDGNMSAAGNMGSALKCCPTKALWAKVAHDFGAAVQRTVEAMRLNERLLSSSTDINLLQAWRAFDMLRLLETHQPLPLPLLDWLWACVYKTRTGAVVHLNKLVYLSLLKFQEVSAHQLSWASHASMPTRLWL